MKVKIFVTQEMEECLEIIPETESEREFIDLKCKGCDFTLFPNGDKHILFKIKGGE